jgi:hypothetical protein
MEPEQRRAAKQQMLELMEAGGSWQEAATTAGVQTSRATAYRLSPRHFFLHERDERKTYLFGRRR